MHLGWTLVIREVLANDTPLYTPRSVLTPGREAIVATVKRKMREFNTSHKS